MIKPKGAQHKDSRAQVKSQVNLVDGPPLDFSFKNIRTLQEIIKLKPASGVNEPMEETSKLEMFLHKSSEIETGENNQETRLNIVRTIELDEQKKDIVKQLVNKKTEKVASKVVKKTEVKTTSLFLRYNKLRSVQGFLEITQLLLPGLRFEQLSWIDLSHNRLTQISKELQGLPQLKNLYLHVNFITNFKEFENLKEAKLLRTFTIHGNPIENYPEFRCLLTCILPTLQKIDSTLLTKRQKERAEVLQKQGGKYPVIPNPQKPPEESEEEDDN